ncbi:MAG TPA: glycosyltransferase [Burkholderiales bacterium]
MHALIPFCTIPGPSFYQDFIDGLESALAELGHTSERFGFAEIGALSQAEMERFFAWTRTSRCDLVLDVCCWGFALSRVRQWDGKSAAGATIFDWLGARYVALMFDQPCFQPVSAILSESLVLGYPDRGHPEMIASIYPALRPSAMLFMPPATRPENDRSPARWRDRQIPLLYAGNLEPGAIEPFWADLPQRDLYAGAAGLIDARPEVPLHRAIEEVRRSLDLELTQEERLAAQRALECFLRNRQRHHVVTSLAAAGLPMEVYGNGWDAVQLGPSARLHPSVDYQAYLGLIGDARVCLDTSTYLGGANDRAVQFAVNGTVFFSNAHEYLREAFGGTVEFYSTLDLAGAAERMRELLARPEEIEARSARLRETALKAHLWRHRLEALFAAMP